MYTNSLLIAIFSTILASLAACGGGGSSDTQQTAVEAVFGSSAPPYDSAGAMRTALEGNGVKVYSLECGYADSLITAGGQRLLYWQVVIDSASTQKVLSMGGFRVVLPEFVVWRAGTLPC